MRTTLYIVKHYVTTAFTNPRWVMTWIGQDIKYWTQRLYLPRWKTDRCRYDSVYDGLSENDFAQGHFIGFLCKLSILDASKDRLWAYWAPEDNND